MNIDFPDEDIMCGYLDLAGSFFTGFNEEAHVVIEGWAEEALALVSGDLLAVPVPWRP